MSAPLRCLTLGLALLASCTDPVCNRPECALFNQHAENDGHSRLAGTVTDFSVFPDGCQECLLRSDATIRVWPAGTPPIFGGGDSPDPVVRTSPVDGRYSVELDAGAYVVCVDDLCYDASILENATTTLNVREVLAEDGGPSTQKVRMAVGDGSFFEPAPMILVH